MADFALVDQLAGLRSAFAAPPTSLDSYAPPVAPDLAPTASSAAAPASTGGVNAVGGLVDFGGKKISARVAPHVQQLAKQFPGLRFTSGYRDPEHNAKVNGVKNSHHLNGDASDWSGSARDMQAGAAWARANGAREVLIHNAGSGQHLHVAW